MERRTSKLFGLELLALIFALPWALLMWSMIFFFGAFMVTCMRVPDTVARSIIGVAAVIMVLLIALRQRIRAAFKSIFEALSTKEGALWKILG